MMTFINPTLTECRNRGSNVSVGGLRWVRATLGIVLIISSRVMHYANENEGSTNKCFLNLIFKLFNSLAKTLANSVLWLSSLNQSITTAKIMPLQSRVIRLIHSLATSLPLLPICLKIIINICCFALTREYLMISKWCQCDFLFFFFFALLLILYSTTSLDILGQPTETKRRYDKISVSYTTKSW